MSAPSWRLSLVAAVAMLLCAAGPAHAQRVGQRIVVEPPTGPVGEVQTAKRYKPLLTQVVRSERHVKLLSPVRESYRHVVSHNEVDLPAGAILHAASTDGDLFCAPIELVFGACFEDTDQDGRFDVIYEAASFGSFWSYLAFHTDGRVSTAFYRSPRRISPVAFVDAAPQEAITSIVELVLYDNYSARAPQRQVKATLNALVGKARPASLRADSGPFRMDGDGGGYGSLLGAEIHFLGFEPNGAVRYRVLRPIDSTPTQFNITPF